MARKDWLSVHGGALKGLDQRSKIIALAAVVILVVAAVACLSVGVPLYRYYSLAPIVFYGQVTDELGKPVPDAEVTVTSLERKIQLREREDDGGRDEKLSPSD